MENKFCYKCGFKIPMEAAFCTSCGESQINTSNDSITKEVTNENINDQTKKINKKVIGSSNPVSFTEALKLFWKNFFNFGGKSSRSEFWYWWLIQAPILLLWIPTILINFSSSFGRTELYIFTWVFIAILLSIWTIACIVPTLSLQVRRLRDAGVSNILITALMITNFIPLIHYATEIIIFVLSVIPSIKIQND